MTSRARRRPPLTLAEASTYTGLTARFLRREIQRRRVAVVRLGRMLRFDVEDLDEYLARNRVPVQAQSQQVSGADAVRTNDRD
jgi:excisionase family DNA binding protein